MSIESLLGFALAMFILAVTPGPGVFASVSQALSEGFRSSWDVIAGIILGDLLFLILAVFGLSAIAYALGDLFFIIKWIGGTYLIWLGWRMWRRNPDAFHPTRNPERRSARQRFMGGFLITLGNPKVILFYAGFLPTILELARLRIIDVLMVAGVVTMVLGGVMGAYAYSAARARQLFSSERARRNLNRSAGTVMMGAGVIIVTR